MTFLLIIIVAWLVCGVAYSIAIIRHLDEYSAEWFIKYLRIEDNDFDSAEERKAVMSMTPKECLRYMRVLVFFGLVLAGPIGFTIAPYKEVVADIKLWKTAGSLRRARELSTK
ncbi:putative membrane protein [Salmonella phage smaug]|uniref:Putative membrane protein n=2 Tax=Epseptimavirus TaxID=2732017 RepID=A0A6G8RCT7_9CAUD|nr:putative membrane protein [Salmonella phage phagemcphageface]QIO01056.1 putative membrane protein [Salmonella phage smaug]